jgi:hypothetical protein
MSPTPILNIYLFEGPIVVVIVVVIVEVVVVNPKIPLFSLGHRVVRNCFHLCLSLPIYPI